MGDVATAVTIGDVAEHLNIPSPSGSQEAELEGFLFAADAHVTDFYGSLINVARTETVEAYNGSLWVKYHPLLSVTSLTSGSTVYTTEITTSRAGRASHTALHGGRWVVVYLSGYAAFPADLRLAVLEDIRGLFQRGQLGPPGAIAAFGMDDAGPSFRPVNMWPRIDEWVSRQRGARMP